MQLLMTWRLLKISYINIFQELKNSIWSKFNILFIYLFIYPSTLTPLESFTMISDFNLLPIKEF